MIRLSAMRVVEQTAGEAEASELVVVDAVSGDDAVVDGAAAHPAAVGVNLVVDDVRLLHAGEVDARTVAVCQHPADGRCDRRRRR